MFFTRVIYENKIDNVDGVEAYYKEYLNIYQNSKVIKKIVNTLFSDKKMIRTFPNIKLTLKDGTIIWIKDILKDSSNLITSELVTNRDKSTDSTFDSHSNIIENTIQQSGEKAYYSSEEIIIF